MWTMPEKRKLTAFKIVGLVPVFKNIALMFFTLLSQIALCFYITSYILDATIIGSIVLYALSVASAVFSFKTFSVMIKVVNQAKHKILSIIVFALFSLYTALALSGNILLMTPWEQAINSLEWIKFGAVFLWAAPISAGALSILYFLSQKNAQKKRKPVSKKQINLLFIICFSIVIAQSTILLIAYNPAISNFDATLQFMQAKGDYPIINWHSPYMTLILRLLLGVYDNASFIVMVQCACFAYVIARAASSLYKNGGLSFSVAIILTFAFVMMPGNYIHFVTLRKDTLYCAVILWLTVLMYELISNPQKCIKSLRFCIEMIMAMASVYLFRQNGIVPFIFIALGVLALFKANARSICIVFAAAAFIFFITGPIYDMLDVRGMAPGSKYIGLGHDIFSVEQLGGDVSEEAQHLTDEMEVLDDYEFSVYRSTYTYGEGVQIQESMGEFLKIYLDTYSRNPALMTKAIFCRNDAIYSMISPAPLALSAYTLDGQDYEYWAENYPPRKPNALTGFFERINQYTIESDFLRNIIWHTGVYTWIIILSALVLAYRKRTKYLFMIIPIAGQIISLILSCSWNDYRYYWPIMVCGLFVLAASAAGESKKEAQE
jgi:hypothetical protein